MRIEKVSKITPKGHGASVGPSQDGDNVQWRNGHRFNWEALIACVLHPAKVAIIEALMCIDRPASATQIEELFAGSKFYLGIITYHLKGLEGMGVLEIARTEAVRGATEKFYFFPDAMPAVGTRQSAAPQPCAGQ